MSLGESSKGNMDGGGQSFMNSERGGAAIPARSYKEMLEVLKQVNQSCDSLSEQICDLNMKFSDDIIKAAMLIDPSVAKILHAEGDNYPQVMTSSQQTEKVVLSELDNKYAEMCTALDHYKNNKKDKRPNEIEDMEH